jgi:hypothetical protein
MLAAVFEGKGKLNSKEVPTSEIENRILYWRKPGSNFEKEELGIPIYNTCTDFVYILCGISCGELHQIELF